MRESEHAVSRITVTAVVTMLALMLAFAAYGTQRSQAQTPTASEEVSGTLLARFGDPPPGSDAGTRTDVVLADRGGDETELVLDRGARRPWADPSPSTTRGCGWRASPSPATACASRALAQTSPCCAASASGDPAGVSSPAETFSITVDPVNDAPKARGEKYTAAGGEPLRISRPGVLKNDTDVDRDGLRAIRTSGPKHGSLTLNGPGSFVYEPKDGYAGRDSFTYGATDGEARSEPVTVEIQVEAGALHHHRHRRQRRPARHRERRRNLRPRRQRRDPRKAGDDVLIGRAGKGRFVGGTGKDEERQ